MRKSSVRRKTQFGSVLVSMKHTFIAFLTFTLIGCQAAEEKAASLQERAGQAVQQKVDEGKVAANKVIDDKVNEAKDAASKAIQSKIEEAKADAAKAAQQAQADIMDKVTPDKTYEAEKEHAAFMADYVQKSKEVDSHTKEWIAKTLASSDKAVQSLAIATMQTVYVKFPEHREWLEQQVKGVVKASDGPIKQAWEDILTNWQRIRAVAESQR